MHFPLRVYPAPLISQSPAQRIPVYSLVNLAPRPSRASEGTNDDISPLQLDPLIQALPPPTSTHDSSDESNKENQPPVHVKPLGCRLPNYLARELAFAGEDPGESMDVEEDSPVDADENDIECEDEDLDTDVVLGEDRDAEKPPDTRLGSAIEFGEADDPEGDQELPGQFSVNDFTYEVKRHYPLGKSQNYTGTRVAPRGQFPPLHLTVLELRARLGLDDPKVYGGFRREVQSIIAVKHADTEVSQSESPMGISKRSSLEAWNRTLQKVALSKTLPPGARYRLNRWGFGVWDQWKRYMWHTLDTLVRMVIKNQRPSLKLQDEIMRTYLREHPEWDLPVLDSES